MPRKRNQRHGHRHKYERDKPRERALGLSENKGKSPRDIRGKRIRRAIGMSKKERLKLRNSHLKKKKK